MLSVYKKNFVICSGPPMVATDSWTLMPRYLGIIIILDDAKSSEIGTPPLLLVYNM